MSIKSLYHSSCDRSNKYGITLISMHNQELMITITDLTDEDQPIRAYVVLKPTNVLEVIKTLISWLFETSSLSK